MSVNRDAFTPSKLLKQKKDRLENEQYVPTGSTLMDIVFGSNCRDLDGNLTAVNRGMLLSKINLLSSIPGGGKTTFLIDALSYSYKVGYPLLKVVIFDTDDSGLNNQRLSAVTKLTPEECDELFDVYAKVTVERIEEIVAEYDKMYNDAKFEPVEIVHHITGEKKQMKPYVIFLFDTLTSATTDVMTFDGDGDSNSTENHFFRTLNLKLSGLIPNADRACQGNCIWWFTTHVVENQPNQNQTVAEKQYKSSTNAVKDRIPKILKARLSFSFRIFKVEDGQNKDSSTHPINKYCLIDCKDSGAAYVAHLTNPKGRAGAEGVTKFCAAFVNGSFEHELSDLLSAINIGAIVQGSGMYPTASEPNVFTLTDEPEYKELANKISRNKKSVLKLEGYPRNTNVFEARWLMKYQGENEEILKLKEQFLVALYQQIEKKCYYELESNNITMKDVFSTRNSVSLHQMIMSKIHQNSKNIKDIPVDDTESVLSDEE